MPGTSNSSQYVGRFAPSPTGPLHYGSLLAALGSYLDAKHHQGRWLLRIEDLDPPRESAEAPGIIKQQLSAFGLHWDGSETYQSHRIPAYEHAISELATKGVIYRCRCTRKSYDTIYPGRCRNQKVTVDEPSSIRLLLSDTAVAINDLHLGPQRWQPDVEVGDFIIKRKDGLFAYQLAVVVDDIEQAVTHVVRGADLLESTPRQLALYRELNAVPPQYLHLPVVVGRDGHKLSKQAHAKPITVDGDLSLLRQVHQDLGQQAISGNMTTAEFLTQATISWDRGSIPKGTSIAAPQGVS